MTLLPSAPTNWCSVPVWVVTTSRNEFARPDLPLLSMSATQGLRVRDLATGRSPSEDLAGYRVVRRGDLVINKLSARDGALAVSEFDGIVSPAYWVLKLDPLRVHAAYIHHLLRSRLYLAEIARLSKFMPPAQFDLPWDQFRLLPLLLPSMAEQRRIAAFLDQQVAVTERSIALEKAVAGLYVERLDALREELLVRPDGLTWTPLQRLVDQTRPISYGIVQAGPDVPDGIPYIKTGDMLDFDPERLSKTSPEIESAYRRSRVRPGDLVIAMRASIGALIEVPETLPLANLTQGTARIAPDATIDRTWLRQVLLTRYVQEQFQHRAVGSTFRTLNLWDLRRVPIPVPTPARAVTLGQHVLQEERRAMRLTALRQQKANSLRERKDALVVASITGRFDVTTARDVA